MGLANENLASAGDRINIEILATGAAFTVNVMCQQFDFVIIKELHPCLLSQFCQELGRYPNLKKIGPLDGGDMVVWRPMPGEA